MKHGLDHDRPKVEKTDPETGNVTEFDVDEDHEPHGISVISLHWQYVEGPLVVCVFLLLTSLVKIGFHHADFLSTILPESCMLIVLGMYFVAIIFDVSGCKKFR